ncbi:MAG: SIS domain-containing protein [Herpetosiphonaceae bacterium]|nr:SIS domain-containing protein [Herpetosiphonaceae bacterium]
MTVGEATRLEIASQPDVWQATLNELGTQQPQLTQQLAGYAATPFIVTGCGSTYYLSLATAATLRSVGVAAWALPGSELALYEQTHLPHNFTLLAMSRSGTTSETLWAVKRYREEHPDGHVVAVTCVPNTPLVQAADVALIAPQAQEQSVAQTRSFTTMALLGQLLAGVLAGDPARLERLHKLPHALTSVMAEAGTLPETIGADLSLQRYFFLGSGALYGFACEAMLKTKEMTTSWAEAYHTLEFRHGPMSVVDSSSLVVGLISDSIAEAEIAVLKQMKGLGARTLALTETRGTYDWTGIDQVVELRSGVSEWERGALYLPVIQWIAFYRALAKELDPDNPHNLTAVITL